MADDEAKLSALQLSWKSLIKTRPTKASVLAALSELETDGPRGSVVLGATLIEQFLQALISDKMVKLTTQEHEQLFRGTAPLASFSARTKIAYAFNLIGPKTRSDLDRLRNLRNGFAHSQIVMSFDTPEVVAEIRKFNCISSLVDKDTLAARALFKAVVRIIMIHLISKLGSGLDVGEEIADLG
jgi:DNA-binding MltR family transcriptional regulator